MTIARGFKRNRKTGKIVKKHRVTPAMRRAESKRRHKKMKPLARLHMMKAIRREIATGRTKYGRRVLRPRRHH